MRSVIFCILVGFVGALKLTAVHPTQAAEQAVYPVQNLSKLWQKMHFHDFHVRLSSLEENQNDFRRQVDAIKMAKDIEDDAQLPNVLNQVQLNVLVYMDRCLQSQKNGERLKHDDVFCVHLKCSCLSDLDYQQINHRLALIREVVNKIDTGLLYDCRADSLREAKTELDVQDAAIERAIRIWGDSGEMQELKRQIKPMMKALRKRCSTEMVDSSVNEAPRRRQRRA